MNTVRNQPQNPTGRARVAPAEVGNLTDPDIVRPYVPGAAEISAVAALKTFGTEDMTRRQARTLLAMWSRYSELTPAGVERVLRHFGGRR